MKARENANVLPANKKNHRAFLIWNNFLLTLLPKTHENEQTDEGIDGKPFGINVALTKTKQGLNYWPQQLDWVASIRDFDWFFT